MDWLACTGLALVGGSGIAYLYLNRRHKNSSAASHMQTAAASAVRKMYGDKFLILSAEDLIAELDLQPAIANIKANLGLSNENWNKDALPLLRRFIAFVQRLPASESHHHAGDGGLVKHTLDVAALALLASSARSWPPNAKTEDIARLTAVWRYGILTAALLHDIGKTLTSFDIELYDKPDSTKAALWMPDTGSMGESGRKLYRVTFPDKKTAYEVHAALGWTFFQSIVPSDARKWMNETDPNLIKALRAYLSGNQKDSPLADVIRQADMASTALDLRHGSRQRFATAKRPPLIETVMETLRGMLAERGAYFSIAATAGGDVFRKDNHVFMMAKNVPDYIRSYLGKTKHPAAASFPAENQRIFDTLLEYGAVVPNPADNRKAVTPVAVRFERMDGEVKQHVFTMLCFKLETLYPDGNYPHEFEGTLAVCPEAAAEIHEPAPAADTRESAPEIHPVQAPETAQQASKSMDFMAVQEDVPAPEVTPAEEPEPAPVVVQKTVIPAAATPEPPKAHKKKDKSKAGAGIDALLSMHNLIEPDEDEAETDGNQTTEAVQPQPTPDITAIPAVAESAKEPSVPPVVPKAVSEPKPAKKKATSKLDALFAEFGGTLPSEKPLPQKTESEKIVPEPDTVAQTPHLPEKDTAEAAFEEIQQDRQALPTRSPRPVTVHQPENLLTQPAAPRKKTGDSPFDKQKQALKDEGKRFWNWLANGLADGNITVNQSGSPVHFVKQGMLLVTPAIFREYAGGVFDKNNPSCPGLLAQKGFTALGLHERTKRSAIFTALAVKSQQKLLFHCYLIPESKVHLVIKADSRPPNNVDIALADSQNLLQPKANGETS